MVPNDSSVQDWLARIEDEELYRKATESTVYDWLGWVGDKEDYFWKLGTLCLGGISPADDVPIRPLLEAVIADREPTSFWSIIALGRMEEKAAEATPILCEIVTDHHQFGIRQSAILALSKIAPRDAQAKATVFLALGDVNAFVRREALQALIRFHDHTPDELLTIKAMENDQDKSVARWSEIALRNIRLRDGK